MAVKAYNTITLISIDDVNISMTEPESPVLDQLWLDTSKEPNELMRYDGTGWVRTQHNSLEELDPSFKTEYDNVVTSLGTTITERTTVGGVPVTEAITELTAGQAEFVKYIDIDRPSATIIDGGNLKTGSISSVNGGAWFDLDKPEIVMEGTQANLSITPENPLKLMDKNGNFIGGLGVADGTLGLVAGVLTNDPNMNTYAIVGKSIEGGGDRFAFYNKQDNKSYEWILHVSGDVVFTANDKMRLYFHRTGGYGNAATYIVDGNRIARLCINTVNDDLGHGQGYSEDALLLSADTNHAIGVNNTGPYFIKNSVKSYLDITESGSNEQGEYIKFDDGTMICYQKVIRTAAANAVVAHSWYYPEIFKSGTRPIVSLTPGTSSGAAANGAKFTSGVAGGGDGQGPTNIACAGAIHNLDTSSREVQFHLKAIGRWK